jgi:DNA-binding MurR/RpiR family transcriptional regulator
MGNRQQIQALPAALRMTLEKARAEFGAVVRKIRWGDGPVYVCAEGDYAALGPAAACALETLVGWPVVAHSAEIFQTYALSLLRARSVLVMISAGGEWPEGQELAHTAHKRDCTLVVLANNPDSPLVKSADHIFLARAEGDTESPAVAVCLHAALNFLAFEAARVLKRPEPQWDLLEREFDELPEKLDWVFTQLSAAVRALAAEVTRFPSLRIVGGGFYRFPAWRAARRMRLSSGVAVEATEASEFCSGLASRARRDDALLLLSGSHSKIKRLLHRCAAQAHTNGVRVFSLTDSNDRELAERSDLGILVPPLLEPSACTLTMFMLELLAMEARRVTK